MAQAAPQAAAQTILIMGDSLSAEYGLKRGEGWVALLQKRLAEQKIDARVVNASISGETTSGGRSRIDALLKLNKPDVVVLELGANDALRGLPIKDSEANLTAMTRASQMVGAKVLLLGMQVPPNYGMDYLNRFSRMFTGTGSTTGAPVVPFFLKGVADAPDPIKMFQADRIHPVAAAHPLMLDNVWPQLRKLLK
ncbi:arylesterase [soil metagenome]